MIIINLYNKTKQEYGQDYKNHILEQWKVCVEMTDKVSERRVNTNKFFLSLNSAIVTISILFSYEKEIIVSIIGLFISGLWIHSISNYKKLNSHKFKIINELEKKLPTQPYNYEWYIIGKGNDRKKYKKLTDIEKLIPKMFIIIYIGLMVYNMSLF